MNSRGVGGGVQFPDSWDKDRHHTSKVNDYIKRRSRVNSTVFILPNQRVRVILIDNTRRDGLKVMPLGR